MRTLLSTIALFLISPVLAQDCQNDYSGTQQTSDFNLEISTEADLARTPLDFLNAASNWLYFSPEGGELRGDMVGLIRLRDIPVYLPACNDIGQCASIRIQSVAYELFGINWPGVHLGYSISATINGITSTRFIQLDSRIPYNHLSAAAAADKRCRDNQGRLKDEEPVTNDEEEDEENEDEEDNYGDEDDSFWEDDWDWADEEDEPCEACEFYFDGDEDGYLDDEAYGPTEEDWIEEL